MRYVLVLIALAYGLATNADTLVEREAQLSAASGVLDVWRENDNPTPVPRSQALWQITLHYAVSDGPSSRLESATLLIYDYSGESESATWFRRVPEVLRAEEKFLSDRTTGGWDGLTRAQQWAEIESFCNEVYQAAAVGAQAIRSFNVSSIQGDTVQVSGYFDLGNTWQYQTWFIRLVNPNGSVAAPYSNIEFKRVVDQDAAA